MYSPPNPFLGPPSSELTDTLITRDRRQSMVDFAKAYNTDPSLYNNSKPIDLVHPNWHDYYQFVLQIAVYEGSAELYQFIVDIGIEIPSSRLIQDFSEQKESITKFIVTRFSSRFALIPASILFFIIANGRNEPNYNTCRSIWENCPQLNDFTFLTSKISNLPLNYQPFDRALAFMDGSGDDPNDNNENNNNNVNNGNNVNNVNNGNNGNNGNNRNNAFGSGPFRVSMSTQYPIEIIAARSFADLFRFIVEQKFVLPPIEMDDNAKIEDENDSLTSAGAEEEGKGKDAKNHSSTSSQSQGYGQISLAPLYSQIDPSITSQSALINESITIDQVPKFIDNFLHRGMGRREETTPETTQWFLNFWKNTFFGNSISIETYNDYIFSIILKHCNTFRLPNIDIFINYLGNDYFSNFTFIQLSRFIFLIINTIHSGQDACSLYRQETIILVIKSFISLPYVSSKIKPHCVYFVRKILTLWMPDCVDLFLNLGEITMIDIWSHHGYDYNYNDSNDDYYDYDQDIDDDNEDDDEEDEDYDEDCEDNQTRDQISQDNGTMTTTMTDTPVTPENIDKKIAAGEIDVHLKMDGSDDKKVNEKQTEIKVEDEKTQTETKDCVPETRSGNDKDNNLDEKEPKLKDPTPDADSGEDYIPNSDEDDSEGSDEDDDITHITQKKDVFNLYTLFFRYPSDMYHLSTSTDKVRQAFEYFINWLSYQPGTEEQLIKLAQTCGPITTFDPPTGITRSLDQLCCFLFLGFTTPQLLDSPSSSSLLLPHQQQQPQQQPEGEDVHIKTHQKSQRSPSWIKTLMIHGKNKCGWTGTKTNIDWTAGMLNIKMFQIYATQRVIPYLDARSYFDNRVVQKTDWQTASPGGWLGLCHIAVIFSLRNSFSDIVLEDMIQGMIEVILQDSSSSE